MIIFYDKIPAYREAKLREQRLREAAFKGRSFSILGMRLRAMTVRDFIVLQDIESPLLRRTPPGIEDLCLFLWILSDPFDLWARKVGWRQFGLLRWVQSVQAYFHGRRCRSILKIKMIERMSRQRRLDCPIGPLKPIELGEHSPSSRATKLCFDYVDAMFLDSPPVGVANSEPHVSYLAYWSTELFTNGVCRCDEDFLRMPIPRMFQHLKHIRRRDNPGATETNRHAGAMRRKIIQGLNKKEFTAEDLEAGKVSLN